MISDGITVRVWVCVRVLPYLWGAGLKMVQEEVEGEVRSSDSERLVEEIWDKLLTLQSVVKVDEGLETREEEKKKWGGDRRRRWEGRRKEMKRGSGGKRREGEIGGDIRGWKGGKTEKEWRTGGKDIIIIMTCMTSKHSLWVCVRTLLCRGSITTE